MMKKLQVMIKDELMEELKIAAVRQGKTLKALVEEMLDSHMEVKPSVPEQKQKQKPKATKKETKPKPKQVKEETPNDGKTYASPGEYDTLNFFMLRKPVYLGKEDKGLYPMNNGIVEWFLDEGDQQWYDDDKTTIPFTYKKANGEDHYPTDEEIEMIEEAYEKKVIFEK